MMKKKIAAFLSVLFCAGLLVGWMYSTPSKSRPNATKEFIDAYEASCTIVIGGGNSGTGVILNTGYVVTAAHLFDIDNDEKVTIWERLMRDVAIRTWDGRVYPCFVIACGSGWDEDVNEDIAILQIMDVNGPTSNVRLATNRTVNTMPLGQSLFVIGRTDSGPPHITTGVLSSPSGSGRGRVSATVSYGNSGGGVFNRETGELVGVITNLRVSKRYAPFTVTIPHLSAKKKVLGMITVYSQIEYWDFLSDWGEFLDADDIRWIASTKGCPFSVDQKPIDKAYLFNFAALIVGGTLMLVGIVWAILKNS
jgi:hypothetical protein